MGYLEKIKYDVWENIYVRNVMKPTCYIMGLLFPFFFYYVWLTYEEALDFPPAIIFFSLTVSACFLTCLHKHALFPPSGMSRGETDTFGLILLTVVNVVLSAKIAGNLSRNTP